MLVRALRLVSANSGGVGVDVLITIVVQHPLSLRKANKK